MEIFFATVISKSRSIFINDASTSLSCTFYGCLRHTEATCYRKHDFLGTNYSKKPNKTMFEGKLALTVVGVVAL